MAQHLDHDSGWNGRSYSCDCGWNGDGEEARHGPYGTHFELGCPTCNDVLAVVGDPPDHEPVDDDETLH